MKRKMKVRIIRDWRNKKVGDVFEPYSAALASGLIRSKFAVEVPFPEGVVECMALEPAAENTMANPEPVKRGRGRPRKHPMVLAT